MLVIGAGFGLGWKQQHDALVGAAEDHLGRAERMRDAEDWDQARQALDRAEDRLASGGPARLRDRLQRLRGELDVVRQLEEARMQQLTMIEGEFDYAGADRAYRDVFSRLGLDLLREDVRDVTEQIARSPIRRQLVAALDNWAHVKRQLRSKDEERLLAVAQLADDDPWRQELRTPSVRKDRATLERLAKQDESLIQPPANLYLLSLATQSRPRRPSR